MLNTGKLAGKTLYITGASRGIGKAIALKAARDGANVVVAAKTVDPHPKLPGTIYSAAQEIEDAGGKALPCVVDVRDEASIQKSIEEAVKKFGGIDILVNNASAISLTGTEATPMKRYDLMHSINTRGTFLVSKLAIPYLRASKKNPHILNLSPPLSMKPMWFKDTLAYTMAKYGMSMCVLGMSEEFKDDGIAVNGLWPQTAIITAAMEMLGGKDIGNMCRKVDIMADAAYIVLNRDSRNFTGNFVIDEDILREEGVRDFDQYAVKPGNELLPDGFIDGLDVNPFAMAAGVSSSKPSKKGSSGGASSAASGGSIAKVFKDVEGVLNEDLVKKVNAVYAFNVSGNETGTYFIDLKNGSGSVGSGDPTNGPADVTFTLNDGDFVDMFQGKLKPTNAFMTGKLKLSGDMGKAMALEKMMKKMNSRGYHTSSVRLSSESGDGAVAKLFKDVEGVLSEDLVKKVDAVYSFKVQGPEESSWFIDLKNGSGSVGSGDPAGGAADCTFTLKDKDMVDMFSGKLKPTNAFMTGKLKLAGDMGKAMKLEKMMKKMSARGYHTYSGPQIRIQGNHSKALGLQAVIDAITPMRAGVRAYSSTVDDTPLIYENVPQVFDRIAAICNEETVKNIQSIFVFDIEGVDKYFLDFKNGSGKVGTGDPEHKPDVVIKMNEEVSLKIFNRTLKPATAFMTGQIKLRGDLAKALALEKIMAAARDEALARRKAGN